VAPAVTMNDEDVLAVLHEHTCALSVSQILTAIDGPLEVSRSTLKVHLQRLVGGGQVLQLSAQLARHYGAQLSTRAIPSTLFYILPKHGRAWDITREGLRVAGGDPVVQEREVARAGELSCAVELARQEAEAALLATAGRIREGATSLKAWLCGDRSDPERADVAVQIGWMEAVAAQVETAALEILVSACIPAPRMPAVGDREMVRGDQRDEVEVLRYAICSTWEATVPADSRHAKPLCPYDVGPQFLASTRRMPVTLSQLMRAVVRVLASRPAPEAERRPRRLSATQARLLGIPGSAVAESAAWVMRIAPEPGPETLLTWWQDTDNRVELAAVVSPSGEV
jgi:hypothetical protein